MCGRDTTPASPDRQRAEVPIAGHPIPGVTTRAASCDPCLHPLVQALNDGGLYTLASCCGHGEALGRIMLADGRELMVAPDFETADRLWVRL